MTVYAVKDNKHTVMYGVLGVIVGGIVVVLIGVIVYFFKKKKQLTPGNSDRDVTAYQETGVCFFSNPYFKCLKYDDSFM